MSKRKKLKKIEQLAIKWATINEYFDPIIENNWVELPPIAKKFINQTGKQLLEIIKE